MSFTDNAGNPYFISSGNLEGMEFSGFSSAARGASASSTFQLSYSVTVTNPNEAITSLQEFYLAHALIGTAGINTVEQAYDTSGNLVATLNWNPSLGAGTSMNLAVGYQQLNVVLTVTETSGTSSSQASMSRIDQEFGLTSLSNMAVIGDNVWLDAAGTGVQTGVNAGPGVPGVTVNLLEDIGGTYTQVASTTTDSNGLYKFIVNAGTYEEQFVTPLGYTISPQGSLGSDLDSTPNQTTGLTPSFVVTQGQTIDYIDAGIVPPSSHQNGTASIGDNVWLDTNGTGIQSGVNAGPGVADVTVNLLDTSGDVLATTSTDSNGLYAFDNLNAGTYEVQFVTPNGYALSPQGPQGSDLDSTPNQTTGITQQITLATGQDITWVDAGLYQPAALGDYVWLDANDNGIQDSGEQGVAGVTVELENGTGTSVLATTTTDATGYYHFTGLAPGQYDVQFVAPVGYSYSPALQGSNTAVDSNANASGLTAPVTLVSGQTDNTIDAGLYQPAALGDYVWLDANDNGIQDSGEQGVAGVTVELENGTGTSVLATTTTDATGYYHFTGLAPGQYDVQFVAPAGYSYSPALQGSNTAVDSNANSSGLTAPVTLVSGQTDNTIDAGLYQPAALGDYVWLDANDNGIQDSGEQGVAGVTVELENGTGTSVLATTTTDATGYYHFTGLAPGQYDVQFVAPAGYSYSPALQGSNTAVDSNANSSGLTAPVTLVSGQTDNTIDAGLISAPPKVDLAVTKTDGKTVVTAGSTDTYTITVTNNGPGTVNSFDLTDQIPAQLLNPVWGTPSSGSYNPTTGLWNGVTLASGQSVNITLTGTISPAAITNTTTYTATGNCSDGNENATATITTENGEIIVTLSSNVVNATSAGQEVSGITFSLGGAPGAASLGSAAGTLINIVSGGAVTLYSGSITHWGLAESGSTLTLATAGNGSVGGKPIDLIIGNGSYTNANPSITGRDPQIQGTGTFIINAPGVTAGTTINNVQIEFGTGSRRGASGGKAGSSGGSGTITNSVTVSTVGGVTDTNPNNNTATDTDTIVPGTPACRS